MPETAAADGRPRLKGRCARVDEGVAAGFPPENCKFGLALDAYDLLPLVRFRPPVLRVGAHTPSRPILWMTTVLLVGDPLAARSAASHNPTWAPAA